MSLATKYRPKTFEECLGQGSTIKILKRQLDLKQYSNCYLFAGPSGTGKTTASRIFANLINEGKGNPIEIDAASNNGVDNVREIVASANERSIDSEYKVFIIDEAHSISTQGWQAFLKCIEEPPKYTIFMFCTTNPEKIPATINNRVMRFNLSKVATDSIRERLEYISQQEGYANYKEACDYIAKLSMGGVRDAIATLEKCANYSNDLSIDNVLNCLGNFSYEAMFNLTNAIIDGDSATVFNITEDIFNSGSDLKLFIETYLDFILDLSKYSIFQTLSVVKIPSSMMQLLNNTINIEDNINYFNWLSEYILDIKNIIKNDTNSKLTIQVMLTKLCRG